jgi:hypothetical protein
VVRKLILASGAWLALATAAPASIIPVLDLVTPTGGEFQYLYSATLSGDQGLVPGSTLVIFDFAGLVPGSVSAGIYGAEITTGVENTSTLLPPPGQFDDPTIPNLVFRWTGGPFNQAGGPFADITFAGLTARSIYGDTRLGSFSAKAVTNNGSATGEDAFNVGRVGVARAPLGVPEPATWAMMILGFSAMGAVLRRRREVAA